MRTGELSRSVEPGLRVLSEAQIHAIHEASLEVLQRTGYHVPVETAREVLHGAGARIEQERAYIPPEVIEGALQGIKPVTLYDRQGEPALPLGEGAVTFGSLADTFYVLDPQTHKVRPYLKKDQHWFTTLLDGLPNIDWIQVVGQSHDVPDVLQTQVAYAQAVRCTTKPILVYPYDRQGLLDVLDVVTLIAGDESSYQERPFMFCASVPAAPLSGTDYNLALILTCAERDVPLLYYSCPAIGGNSPASLVGTLVLGNADWLAALAIHQLAKPGAPICNYGFTVQLMDMKTTLWAYCAPESHLAYAAIADLARFYQLPAWGLEVQGDVPRIDAQAGVELQATTLFAFLAGVELVHNAGNMGAGKLAYPEAPVLVDEVIAYTRPAFSPLQVDAQALAETVALTTEVGPSGEYVTHDHTLSHFRDFWYPTVFDRSNFDPLSLPKREDLASRLNARVQALIGGHRPKPLPGDVLRELSALEAVWEKRLG